MCHSQEAHWAREEKKKNNQNFSRAAEADITE